MNYNRTRLSAYSFKWSASIISLSHEGQNLHCWNHKITWLSIQINKSVKCCILPCVCSQTWKWQYPQSWRKHRPWEWLIIYTNCFTLLQIYYIFLLQISTFNFSSLFKIHWNTTYLKSNFSNDQCENSYIP